MKTRNLACLAMVLVASLCGAKAVTLTAWTLDNLPIGPNSSPQPSTGFGAASALGMGNSFNGTNSISSPDVQSRAGSSTGDANSWRIRGSGTAPNGGNGWSTDAPIGTQGARFTASTAGYYRIKVSFDVYATPDAEANLQVQYTTEGTIWQNATIASVGTLAIIASNSSTSNSTVTGSYVILTNNGTTGWNNQITVDLSGVSGADNNPRFAVRLVNASTGTNCVDTTGAIYNNTSGDWTFDNIVIQGISIDTITAWTFESYGTSVTNVFHPLPEFGAGLATSLGFDTSFIFSDGSNGSTNAPDTLAQAGSSTPTAPICWRVRGQGPGNGWNTQSPIGSQGAEFDVSTVNYSNIVLAFDLYFTTQGEAKMQVEYTTDGLNWSNAANLAYGANPTFIQTNSDPLSGGSPNTVVGTYFYQTTGQNWYNNLVVDLTGVAGVDNNPSFGVRIVNAAQGADCVAFNGGSYNNSSGNCRFDNVTVGGEFNGSFPPAIAYDPSATVDGPFTNSFTDDPTWRSLITAIYVNGSLLTNSAYTTNIAGQIVYTPSKSVLLQSSGVKNLVIYAAGYSNAKVTQPLAAGLATKLAITTQPAAPTGSGGTLVANPVLAITDQYGNGTTNPYPNVVVTASAAGGAGWTLAGAIAQPSVGGIVAFTNLTATVNGSSAVSGAAIAFNVVGYGASATNFNSSTFNIGKPSVPFTPGNLAVIQLDTVANNTTFSVIEIKPSAAGQTSPVNIVPISATGTNALRLCSAGSSGKLSLSDDGTLLCFLGFADGSSATPDETFILDRAVGTLNCTNQFTSPLSYTSISLGGSQGRSCCTLDNTNWIVDDKGGLYMNDFLWSAQNNVVVRTFAGVPYVETQKTAGGSPIPVVYALAMDNPGSINHAIPNNLTTDPVASDFYLISSNVMYILDGISSSSGIIKKYSWVDDGMGNLSWVADGAFTNVTGGDSLFATTNGNGGVYLYYTTGASTKNSVIRLTDAAGYNAPLNVISSNVIYTAAGSTYVKGLTFVPQQTASATELIPPPILTAQTAATVGSSFNVTTIPDDPAWRSAILGITVNGAVLPSAAYDTTQGGKIVFNPAQSTLLQTNGSKTIAISATGYSTNSVVQSLGTGPAANLVITTQPTAPLGDGGRLAVQPVVKIEDLYGNVVTNGSPSIVAAAAQETWTLGGSTTKAAVLGIATFTNLTAFSTNPVTGATIDFSANGMTGATSAAFNIPAPINSVLAGGAVTGGKFGFTFTNLTGLGFSVRATNNLTAPIATWPVIGNAAESPAGSGHYQFQDQNPATNDHLFYRLSEP